MIVGDGGNGNTSMRREKFAPFGEPDGGGGGQGGSVRAVVDHSISTLINYRFARRHFVRSDKNGRGTDCYGVAGEDITLRISVDTAICDADTEELIIGLIVNGQCLCPAQGGEGGRGNIHFKSSTSRTPRQKADDKAGRRRNLRPELKVLTSTGLLGMPNIGRSALIAAISNTRLKIADYSFATLHPNLGVVRTGPSKSFMVANTLSLTRGAAKGTGLGH